MTELSLREKTTNRFLYLISTTRLDARSPPTCASLASPSAAFFRGLAKLLLEPTVKFRSKQLKEFQSKDGPPARDMSRVSYAYIASSKRKWFFNESRKARSAKKVDNSGPCEAGLIERGIRASLLPCKQHYVCRGMGPRSRSMGVTWCASVPRRYLHCTRLPIEL